MKCPHCKTENREDRASCYHCGRDLALLRLISNKARTHFNSAVKHAEDGNYFEALGELKSALELNSQLVEAYVLRGTILARLERSDEARETFRKALRMRPNAWRAYGYLRELEDVESMTPLRRRVRALLLGTGIVTGVALLIAVGAVVSTGPDKPDELRKAWIAFQDGKLAESRRLAAGIEEDRERETLLGTIDLAVQTRLDAASRLAQSGDYSRAVAQLSELRRYDLPRDTQQVVTRQEETIREALLSDLESLSQQESVEVEPRPLLARHKQVLDLFPEAAQEAATILERRQERLHQQFTARIAAAERALEEGEPLDRVRTFLASAREYAEARNLPYEKDVTRVREGIARRRGEQLLSGAEEAVREDNREAYEMALTHLQELDPQQPGLVEQAMQLRSVLEQRERESLRTALLEALSAEALPQAVAAADEFQAAGGVIDGELAARVHHARRVLAITSYYELMEMADTIEAGDLEEGDAQRVLSLVERARGPLPPRLEGKARQSLGFFAAMANRSLGWEESARKEIEGLRQIAPDSAWLLLWDEIQTTS